MKFNTKNFRALVKCVVNPDLFSNEKCNVYDAILKIDENTRNHVSNTMATQLFKDLDYSVWDVTNDYTEYCEYEFGSVNAYQGETGIVPYKAFCAWFNTLISKNIDNILDTSKQYKACQIARKIRQFLLSRDSKALIQRHCY